MKRITDEYLKEHYLETVLYLTAITSSIAIIILTILFMVGVIQVV